MKLKTCQQEEVLESICVVIYIAWQRFQNKMHCYLNCLDIVLLFWITKTNFDRFHSFFLLLDDYHSCSHLSISLLSFYIEDFDHHHSLRRITPSKEILHSWEKKYVVWMPTSISLFLLLLLLLILTSPLVVDHRRTE